MTVIVEDFNNPLTSMDRSFQTEISNEIVTLNGTLDQANLIDIYRTFQPQIAEHTFFSSTYATLSRIDHMLGYKRVTTNLRV